MDVLESLLFVSVFLAFSVLCLVLSRIPKEEFGGKEKFNLPLWVHFYCFVVSHIGLIPLYFGYSHYHYHYLGISNGDKVLFVALISCSSLLFYGLGVFVCRHLKINEFRLKKFIRIEKSSRFKGFDFIFGLGLFACCGIVFFIYLASLDSIPILEAFSGSHEQFSFSRSEATNNYSGPLPFHYFEMFFHDILFFSFFFWVAYYLSEKRFRTLALIPPILAMVVFASFVTGEKAPFVWFLVGLTVTLWMSLKSISRIRISSGLMITIGVVSISVLISLVGITMKTERYTAFDYIRSISQRITVGAPAVAYFQVEMAHMELGYLEGNSFPNPKGYFPFEPVLLPLETMSYMNSRYSNVNIVGSAPGPYWSELYVNFGILGVSVFSFIVGFLICVFSRILGLMGSSCIAIAIVAWASTHFIKIAETGLGSFLFDQKSAFVIFLAIVYVLIKVLVDQLGETSGE
jgi:oligosaccharide repeat unit polymerase